MPVLILLLPECGVTANISALGAEDSGFESLHSDQIEPLLTYVAMCDNVRVVARHCA
jgi:hypothetical protein